LPCAANPIGSASAANTITALMLVHILNFIFFSA
jgi:hypothetical protein